MNIDGIDDEGVDEVITGVFELCQELHASARIDINVHINVL